MVDRTYPTELQLNKGNSSDTETFFLIWIYVYLMAYLIWDISLLDLPALLKFNDFNCRNKALTAKLLRQGYRYFKLRKAFPKFYRRHSAFVEKYKVDLKTLLKQGISEPEFYGDLVYRFRKKVGKSNFSEQFRKVINLYKRIGYSLDIMRQTAFLVINPIVVDGFALFFNCMTAVRTSDSMTASSSNFNQRVGARRYVFGLARRGSTIGFHLLCHTVELPWVTRFCLS